MGMPQNHLLMDAHPKDRLLVQAAAEQSCPEAMPLDLDMSGGFKVRLKNVLARVLPA